LEVVQARAPRSARPTGSLSEEPHMSEAQAAAAPAAACPVALSALPANFQKHVDPKAPLPLRMMGAKALVPMGPKEMVTALFMLRHSDIVRALANNPATRPSTVDNVCDFCVRSGLLLEDLPAFRAARRRVHGGSAQDEELAKKVAAQQQAAEAKAEAALEQMGATGPDGAEEKPVAPGSAEEKAGEQKKLSIAQQIMTLGVAKKIEWAK